MDWTKLRTLLEAEQYPHRYIHKFIGSKTPGFMAAVSTLERSFPRAIRTTERETTDSKGTCYIALTYEFLANSADEIIALLKATGQLPDLKIIL